MLRLPLLSVAVVALMIPRVARAQDDNTLTTPTTSADEPSAQSATPYNESFSSGEVTPAPPPDQNDSDVHPEKNPDDDPLNDPSRDALPDNFRIGITGALEIPHMIDYSVDMLMMQKYGFSIDRGSVTRSVSGIDVSIVHTDLRFRYHPGGGSFFAGFAIGQHTLSGEKSRDISLSDPTDPKKTISTNATIKATVKANYVAPHIGWFTIWEPGFTMGLDLGWLFPFQSKTTIDESYSGVQPADVDRLRATAEYQKARADANDTIEKNAKKSWPFVTMLRIGWMF